MTKRRSSQVAVESPAQTRKSTRISPVKEAKPLSPVKEKRSKMSCNVCGKNFTKEDRLEQHEFFHTVEKSKTIQMKVEDVEELGTMTVSKTKVIEGITWALEVSNFEDFLHVQVACNRNRECALWECEVDYEVKLISRVKENHSKSKYDKVRLNNKKTYEVVKLYEWDQLIGSEFVINGDVEIEARIVVKYMLGGRVRSQFDFSSPQEYSDAVLTVEDKKFHVSKSIMANQSTEFYDKFYKNFNKVAEGEVKLEGVSAEIFQIVLNLIYDSVNEVDEYNFEDLLKTADKLKIPKVLNILERWITVNECFPIHEELLFTDKYGLEVAKRLKLKNNVKTAEIAREVKESESFSEYSEDLKKKIEKMIKNDS